MTWMERAACAARPGLAWLDDSRRVPEVVVDEMRAVCAACPVFGPCASYVETEDVTAGFWAGQDRRPVEQLALPGSDGQGDAA